MRNEAISSYFLSCSKDEIAIFTNTKSSFSNAGFFLLRKNFHYKRSSMRYSASSSFPFIPNKTVRTKNPSLIMSHLNLLIKIYGYADHTIIEIDIN
ncbi:hypothetical protein H4V97_002230 [Flavobacterium sp. CG_23.5]|uniref:hypothetical protein n=1 Tax=Flavobacterium sp. CG_23.5 TaxID=2760708 RepID=UPI001AE69214|nr:hypothetical protein [Flavobacterium sp. CG_23.5]MBP2283912.1 hypothetical protein [Flavobacterium sp. CG_23.5]